MSMNSSNAASSYVNSIIVGSDTALKLLAKTLDKEFQRAEPTHSNIDITTAKNTLYFTNNTPDKMIWTIAFNCCFYWSLNIEKTAVPVTNGIILEVSNNATDKTPGLEMKIKNMAMENVIREPYYEYFISLILDTVRSIVWEVNEGVIYQGYVASEDEFETMNEGELTVGDGFYVTSLSSIVAVKKDTGGDIQPAAFQDYSLYIVKENVMEPIISTGSKLLTDTFEVSVK